MKQHGGKKKPKAKVIREKRPTAKPIKRPPMVPLPAAWEASMKGQTHHEHASF
jgi:hypothetical protein